MMPSYPWYSLTTMAVNIADVSQDACFKHAVKLSYSIYLGNSFNFVGKLNNQSLYVNFLLSFYHINRKLDNGISQ